MNATPPPSTTQSPRDHAPAGARESVRKMATDRWQAPVRLLYLRKVRTEYHVPGRREDGTVEGTHMIRRFFRNLARVPLMLLFAALQGDGRGADTAFATFFRRGDVRADSADCAALKFADAANAAKRNLWLAWSDDHVALIQASGPSAPVMICQENSDQVTVKTDKRPESAGDFLLKWRDRSCIELRVDRRERRRFAQFDGYH